jgi:hypothetical protein
MLRFPAVPFQAPGSARLLTVCLIALSLTATACAPRQAGPGTAVGNTASADFKAANGKASGQQSGPVEFADIPVPKGRKINVEKTMVVGTDIWFGQLTFDTNYSAEAMFSFYQRELPNYGWGKITAVRAQTSFMTYERQNRVMTVAISPNRIIGSEVTITVSPRESSKPAPGNTPPGTSVPAPVTEKLLTNPPPTKR